MDHRGVADTVDTADRIVGRTEAYRIAHTEAVHTAVVVVVVVAVDIVGTAGNHLGCTGYIAPVVDTEKDHTAAADTVDYTAVVDSAAADRKGPGIADRLAAVVVVVVARAVIVERSVPGLLVTSKQCRNAYKKLHY